VTREDLDALRSSVESLDATVRALAERAESADRTRWTEIERRLGESSRSDDVALATIEGALDDVRAMVVQVREEIDAVKLLSSIPSGDVVDGSARGEDREAVSEPETAPPSTPPAAPTDSPDRDRWIADLAESDSGKRFTAIVELARLRDSSAIPELGKTLASDPDVYCRTEAGRTLGEFRDYSAVPYLITALRDRETMVALTAAEALKSITTKTFGFTNKATPQERREAISRWESWWEKNKDSHAGGGGSNR
jgi:HEAT repeat protein